MGFYDWSLLGQRTSPMGHRPALGTPLERRPRPPSTVVKALEKASGSRRQLRAAVFVLGQGKEAGGAERPPAGVCGAWAGGSAAKGQDLLPARRDGVEVRVSAGHGALRRLTTSKPRRERKRHADIRHAGQFHPSGHHEHQRHLQTCGRFQERSKKGRVHGQGAYWTQGQYDNVIIIDAPDEASATALLMSLGKLGNVRTQTLRAFTAAELAPILDKVV